MKRRPLTVTAAVLWFVAATILALVFVRATSVLRPGWGTGLASAVACQSAAYLIVAFVVARFHENDLPTTQVLGFRKTHFAFYPLALMLGVLLQVPAELLGRLVSRFTPIPPDVMEHQAEMLRMDSTLSAILIPLAAVVLGPVVEELLFRGAFFGGMRRCNSGFVTILVVSVLFAAAHQSGQLFFPLLIIGGVISWMREATGSIGPCLIAHAAFNGCAIFLLGMGWVGVSGEPEHLPTIVAVGGVLACVSIVVAMAILSRRGDSALRAGLGGACPTGTCLTGACLTGARLTRARLTGARLED